MESSLAFAILEYASDVVIFVDTGEIIRLWNRRAEHVLGYACAEALGQPLDMIIPEHLRQAHHDGFRRAIESGHTRLGGKPLTTRVVHKSGDTRYLETSFSLVGAEDNSIRGVVAIGRDITARHLAARAKPGQEKP